MIFLLTTAAHQYTATRHFESFGLALKKIVQPLSYEELFQTKRLRPGVYIFADLERLWPDDAERAAKFWQVMNERPGFSTLNHPTRSLRRYELLRTMYLRGTNRFNVYRLTEHRQPARFPVYLRGENDHDGNRTPRLNDEQELSAAIRQVDQTGRSRENTLITEFYDIADSDGVFHKYSAFCVAGEFVPRHLCFTKHWVVKQPDLVDAKYLAREREYLETNPHAAELREIFALARIDYGRIDYSLAEGVIQVWEINTNPTICTNDVAGGAPREWLQGEFANKLQQAFERLNATSGHQARATIRIDPRDPQRIIPPKTITQRVQQALRWNRLRKP